MFDRITDTISRLGELTDEAKRGLIILVIGAVCIITPLSLMNHFNKQADSYTQKAKENVATAKELDAKSKAKIKTAQIRMKNQPQMRKQIENNVNDFISAQMTIIHYQEDKDKVSQTEYDNAVLTVKKLVSDTTQLTDPDDFLMAPIGRYKGLKITASYSPSFSVYQDNINVVFHFMGDGQPVYIVNSVYDLKSQKLVSFDNYSTAYSDKFYNGLNENINNKDSKAYQPSDEQMKDAVKKRQEAKEAKLKKEMEDKIKIKKEKEAKKKGKDDKKDTNTKSKKSTKDDTKKKDGGKK